jgi:hypothetical protein
VSSFSSYDEEYITKLLSEFEKQGLIVRISKGVYVKAKKTRFGLMYPSVYELVGEIAKRDHAKVIPTGEAAANLLGFSTQVPMNTTFLTTGSARKIALGKRTITLKHGAPKNFTYQGTLMPQLVQALRSMGQNNITPEVKKRISVLLSTTPECETIEHDLLLAPVWIRQLIRNNITTA